MDGRIVKQKIFTESLSTREKEKKEGTGLIKYHIIHICYKKAEKWHRNVEIFQRGWDMP